MLKVMKIFENLDSTSRLAPSPPLRLGPQLPGQLPYKLSVEVRVAVLSQLVEDKPVSYMALSQHIVQALADIIIVLTPHLAHHVLYHTIITNTHSSEEQAEADTAEEDGEEPVEDEEDRQGPKKGVPEPEYKVNLLVDNIL